MNSRLSDYKVHVLTLLSVCVKLTHREMMGKRKLRGQSRRNTEERIFQVEKVAKGHVHSWTTTRYFVSLKGKNKLKDLSMWKFVLPFCVIFPLLPWPPKFMDISLHRKDRAAKH